MLLTSIKLIYKEQIMNLLNKNKKWIRFYKVINLNYRMNYKDITKKSKS